MGKKAQQKAAQAKAERQQRKAQRYLEKHPDLALQAFARAPGLAGATSQAFWMAQAQEAERQTAQFPILNQLGQGARHSLTRHLPKITAFNLRRFSEYPPARRAINALCNPIVDLDWTIEAIPPEQADSLQRYQPSADQQRRISIATRMLQRPNDVTEKSWRVLSEQVLEDLVVGGFGALEVVRSQDPERPVHLYAVDGQSVRINAEWHGDPQEYRYSQSLGYVGMTVGTHNIVDLRDDQLLYLRLNPRTHTPFGLGYLECAFMVVNAWLGSFEYAERRASNATPNFGIFLGENVDMVTARKWQQYWEQEIEGYGKVPILAGGRQPQVFSMAGTNEDALYLKWQEWLVRIIAQAFGLSPLKLNLERDVNRNTADAQAVADFETTAPVANTMADVLTTDLLWGILGWRDLRFRWVREDLDRKREAEVLTMRYTMNALTIDEIREKYDDPPLPDGQGQVTKSVYEERAKAQVGAVPGGLAPPAGAGPGAPARDTGPGPDEPPDEVAALLTQAQAILDHAARQEPASTNGTTARSLT